VVTREQNVKVGDIVLVPWGLEEPVHARVLEIWGARHPMCGYSYCLTLKMSSRSCCCHHHF